MRAVLIAQLALATLAASAPARAAECARLVASADAPRDADTAWAGAIFAAVVAAEARVDLSATRPALRVLATSTAPTRARGTALRRTRSSWSRPLVAYAALARASDGADFLAFAGPRAAQPALRSCQCGDRRGDGAAARVRPCEAPITSGRGSRRRPITAPSSCSPWRPPPTDGRSRRSRSRTTRRSRPSSPPSAACPTAWRCARVAAIDRALARMARVRELYAAALAVAFQPGGVDDLATIAAELAPSTSWDAVPELWVLRAHAHVAAATATPGGWCPPELAAEGLPACRATCAAIFPAHRASRRPSPARADLRGPRRRPRGGPARARRSGARWAHGRRARRGRGVPSRSPSATRAAPSTRSRPSRRTPRPDEAAANRRLFEQQRALLEAPDPADPAELTPSSKSPRGSRSRSRPTTCARARGGVAGALVRRPGHVSRIASTGLAVLADTSLAAWRAACELSPPGVADDGSALHVARCPRWDPSGVVGWTLVAEGDRVLRAVRVKRRQGDRDRHGQARARG